MTPYNPNDAGKAFNEEDNLNWRPLTEQDELDAANGLQDLIDETRRELENE
jgi:hypothetical protein